MTIGKLIVTLLCVGVGLYLIDRFPSMNGDIKAILKFVGIAIAALAVAAWIIPIISHWFGG